ncbi:MAG: molybdopterin molybdenumtransferase MoeA [Candidatus Thorarchaeota archaeon]|nr:molybdopterin molybdenumtransferase MoeA [Candidatus Thorarchaeota archaeon]
MEPFSLLVSHEEAEKIILSNTKIMDRIESIDVDSAVGRVLAEDVLAGQSVPPFDRAAMDGYAVIAEDTFGADEREVLLEIDGVIHAGEVSSINVTRGHCIQIATGSPKPEGADAVVMVEFTEKKNKKVLITKPVYPGANISKLGEDIKKGDVVLKKGTFLTPAKIGTLTALGRTKTEVYQKPRVSIIPTGTEIVQPGQPLKPGQIYDVNSFTLEAILKKNGAVVQRRPVITDDPKLLRRGIESALESDVVVLSGGSSVGERDLLAGILEDMGQVLFHGVQIKPGKPTLFGLINDKPIFGMPGFPTSCLSNAHIFLIPAIRRMARLPSGSERTVIAKMGKRIVSSSGRKQFLTVRLEGGVAHPVFKHSGAITSMAQADGYIMLPVNLDVIEEGQEVEVVILD